MRLYIILYRANGNKPWSMIGEYYEDLEQAQHNIDLYRRSYKGSEYRLVFTDVIVIDSTIPIS